MHYQRWEPLRIRECPTGVTILASQPETTARYYLGLKTPTDIQVRRVVRVAFASFHLGNVTVSLLGERSTQEATGMRVDWLIIDGGFSFRGVSEMWVRATILQG